MTGKTYLVLSTSSYGYQLYDDETKETSFHEHRRKISFQEKKIVIGDRVTLDDAGFINQIEGYISQYFSLIIIMFII